MIDPGYEYVRNKRLLTVDSLCVSYDRPILRGVNFHIDNIHRDGIEQGQVVALLGPSGIGKTQLFRCIGGLQNPTSGTVRLNADTHDVEPGQAGIIMQSYPLLQHRTVKSNLFFVAKTKEARDKALTYLERFNLLDKQNLYPCQLSGGQRQRVAIIQQLLCSSHFLLMDEPFSGLDPIAKLDVCHLVNEIAQIDELNTIIIITHDLESALLTADTILLLGRDRDEQGNPISGASIKQEISLIERDLAWHPDIEKQPRYDETMKEIKALFRQL